ncbi:hypothetical protein [Vibrio taketomensis]|uniref:hypothetical protein n=1 Tax=Vibrio taketomensis TaxID=2572923 RepID=UPI0013899926|nr:hypothetical protein [Vibrio taketomensis]
MKKSTLALGIMATLCATSSFANIYTTESNGSIRHMDTNADGDISVILHLKDKYTYTNDKGKEKTKKYSKTVQYVANSGESFADVLAMMSSYDNIADFQEMPVDVKATGGREFAESFDLNLSLANEYVAGGTVGHAALFHKNGVPMLHVNIDGKYVRAKQPYLNVPSFVKSSRAHDFFKVVVTDILDNVIVGFVEAKQDIPFNQADYFYAKGERIPVYWTLSADSKPSCNKECKNQEQAHMSVSSAQVLGQGKKMPNIKATDDSGEIMDWFQYDRIGETFQGLGDKPYGIVQDTYDEKTYWVYGSAIAKAKEGSKTYYSGDKNYSPGLAMSITVK